MWEDANKITWTHDKSFKENETTIAYIPSHVFEECADMVKKSNISPDFTLSNMEN